MENRCPMVEHISWEKQTSTSTAGTSTRKSTGDNASARVLVLAVVPVHTRTRKFSCAYGLSLYMLASYV